MRNEDEARSLTLTNDVCLLCHNVFGFLSYVSTAAASLLLFNIFELRIYIYFLHTYISIYIHIIYIYILYINIFFYTYILTHTLFFPSFYPSLHTYIFLHVKQHNINNRDLHTYNHARTYHIYTRCQTKYFKCSSTEKAKQ